MTESPGGAAVLSNGLPCTAQPSASVANKIREMRLRFICSGAYRGLLYHAYVADSLLGFHLVPPSARWLLPAPADLGRGRAFPRFSDVRCCARPAPIPYELVPYRE